MTTYFNGGSFSDHYKPNDTVYCCMKDLEIKRLIIGKFEYSCNVDISLNLVFK